jgi:hypothetical protein
LIVVGAVLLLAASCGSRQSRLIVGQWEPVDAERKATVEFTRDGILKVSKYGTSFPLLIGLVKIGRDFKLKVKEDDNWYYGTYQFVSRNQMEFALTFLGKGINDLQVLQHRQMGELKPLPRLVLTVAITPEGMSLTDEKGITTEFRRAE